MTTVAERSLFWREAGEMGENTQPRMSSPPTAWKLQGLKTDSQESLVGIAFPALWTCPGGAAAQWIPEALGSLLQSPEWSRNCLQSRRPGFYPWVRKIPWRREWQPTPVFLPGESHGQRSLAGYSPWGHKESDKTERLTLSLSRFWEEAPQAQRGNKTNGQAS